MDAVNGMVTAAYIAASALFIRSLGGLANPETAREGNFQGMVGMGLAVGATALLLPREALPVLGVVVVAGLAIGSTLAQRVAMTSMPQLVAILHSFVGLAAALVGYASQLGGEVPAGAEGVIHAVALYVGVFVGAVTFTGSVVAWGKLEGKIGSKPLMLPGRHALNAALVLVVLGMLVPYAMNPAAGLAYLVAMTVIGCFIGWHMVMAIGGADMPVVVSMLNSYSGWAAAADGFLLQNDLLIVTGALVGSSGAILSYIMCKAMARSFWSVILGGFGTEEGAAPAAATGPVGDPVATDIETLVNELKEAQSVVIVPGYGMAVAQAQHPVCTLTKKLRARGCEVRFAIHPVAGRLPGHMNVLLAEANLPYDLVLEMDEINDDFPETDVVLVIGANDIVNPGAIDDPSSPIYGMPVLHAWEAARVVVFKRGKGAGYAGVENPLFLRDCTRMLYGDAKKSVDALLAGLGD